MIETFRTQNVNNLFVQQAKNNAEFTYLSIKCIVASFRVLEQYDIDGLGLKKIYIRTDERK